MRDKVELGIIFRDWIVLSPAAATCVQCLCSSRPIVIVAIRHRDMEDAEYYCVPCYRAAAKTIYAAQWPSPETPDA